MTDHANATEFRNRICILHFLITQLQNLTIRTCISPVSHTLALEPSYQICILPVYHLPATEHYYYMCILPVAH